MKKLMVILIGLFMFSCCGTPESSYAEKQVNDYSVKVIVQYTNGDMEVIYNCNSFDTRSSLLILQEVKEMGDKPICIPYYNIKYFTWEHK